MAQPQHVRGDLHCDVPFPCKYPGAAFDLYYPSAYEAYTKEIRINDAFLSALPTYTPVYGEADRQTFNSPRNFWATVPTPGLDSVQNGKGMAEFASRNFVSARTNFDKPNAVLYPLPVFDPTNKQVITVAQLCAEPGANCPSTLLQYPGATVTFYGNQVDDRYRPGTSAPNPRASTESIFDQDLRAVGKDPVFSLNRFDFDQAHKFLIPRAVAYSAGLINYFFRGKIDIVPDPNNAGSHLIKNLGTEPMSGKFALYYDAADGARKQVPDTNGNPLVWDTKVVLANSSGVLGANSDMPVTGFVPPADAKTPGEYMLVFAGDMGEEKADEANGIVGAVAAKFIQAPSTGTLYIAGLDANKQYVGLRVDGNGTQVIKYGEFDPLQYLAWGNYGNYVFSKSYLIKQVAFTQTLSGDSYRTLAIALHQNRYGAQFGFVLDTASNRYIPSRGRAWVAQSPDPSIGKFQFWLFYYNGQNYLNYSREFVDATGAKQGGTGQVALPSTLQFPSYSNGDWGPVSQDGLHVGEFLFSTGTRTPPYAFSNFEETTQKDYYELSIELSATPTAQLKLLASMTATASDKTTWSNSWPGGVTSRAGTSHKVDRTFIGYFNGYKQVYTSVTDFRLAGDISGGLAYSAKCLPFNYDPGFANYQEQLVTNAQFPDGSLTSKATCNESAGQTYSGKRLNFVLSERASDAIYTDYGQGTPISAPIYFRGILIGNAATGVSYVADVSPVGEVFFANPDLSVVIHEPRSGGMPKVVIPPNIIKLLAAVWM